MEYNKAIKAFDDQIKSEYPKFQGDKTKCPSYWQKLLFIETFDLSIKDWNQIRSGDYWSTKDSLQGIEADKFLLERIKAYKKLYR